MRKPKPRAKPLADFLDVCLGPEPCAAGLCHVRRDCRLARDRRRAAGGVHPAAEDRVEAQRPRCGPGGAARARRFWWCGPRAPSRWRCSTLRPVVIERVNTHYGWRCIGRIVLKQGPVMRPEKKRPAAPLLTEADRAEGRRPRRSRSRRTALRLALDRLGEAIVGHGPRKRDEGGACHNPSSLYRRTQLSLRSTFTDDHPAPNASASRNRHCCGLCDDEPAGFRPERGAGRSRGPRPPRAMWLRVRPTPR